jgi:DNA-binding NarL/FixJ family response regulator
MAAKILVADDHEVVRQGIRAILQLPSRVLIFTMHEMKSLARRFEGQAPKAT